MIKILDLLKRLKYYFLLHFIQKSVFQIELEKKCALECVKYVNKRMQNALGFVKKENLWDFVISESTKESFWEFGVCKGYSINYFSKKINQLFGFDSFYGLSEDWKGHNLMKGAFSVNGKIPRVSRNVVLVPGWFKNTLPAFLKANKTVPSIVHVDCDTYEASSFVLKLLAPRLKNKTIIIFDEYLNYRGWKSGEFKAWQEIVKSKSLKYKYIAFSEMTVAVQVL